MFGFVIRTDAGGKVGFGHAVRSLSLAKHMRARYGIAATFYSNPYAELDQMYRQADFNYVLNNGLSEVEFLRKIGEDAPGSLVFIDMQYPYSYNDLRDLVDRLKIIMFHNVCEGMYECDYAIYPSATLTDEIINNPQWSKARAKFLYGPDYIIINESILAYLRKRGGAKPQSHIAITTGASDPAGILVRAIEWINESEIEIPVKALYGFDHLHSTALDGMRSGLKPNIEVREFNYEDLFSARLAISAFGVGTYELVFAGIPVITVGHVERNAHAAEILQERYGCNLHLGLFQEVTSAEFTSAIQLLWNDEARLAKMKTNQQGLIDGNGLKRLGLIIKRCCIEGV